MTAIAQPKAADFRPPATQRLSVLLANPRRRFDQGTLKCESEPSQITS